MLTYTFNLRKDINAEFKMPINDRDFADIKHLRLLGEEMPVSARYFSFVSRKGLIAL
jgi:hypothetical protein